MGGSAWLWKSKMSSTKQIWNKNFHKLINLLDKNRSAGKQPLLKLYRHLAGESSCSSNHKVKVLTTCEKKLQVVKKGEKGRSWSPRRRTRQTEGSPKAPLLDSVPQGTTWRLKLIDAGYRKILQVPQLYAVTLQVSLVSWLTGQHYM